MGTISSLLDSNSATGKAPEVHWRFFLWMRNRTPSEDWNVMSASGALTVPHHVIITLDLGALDSHRSGMRSLGSETESKLALIPRFLDFGVGQAAQPSAVVASVGLACIGIGIGMSGSWYISVIVYCSSLPSLVDDIYWRLDIASCKRAVRYLTA